MYENGKVEIEYAVSSIVEGLKNDPSTRFSKFDFQVLLYSVLMDKSFNSKKYLIRGTEIFETNKDFSRAFRNFMSKFLKHAGFLEASERNAIIDSFEFGPNDIEWIVDSVDEAMYLYAECDKNLRLFRNKLLQLTIRKVSRSGKFDGKITYRKAIIDRTLKAEKKRRKIQKQS